MQTLAIECGSQQGESQARNGAASGTLLMAFAWSGRRLFGISGVSDLRMQVRFTCPSSYGLAFLFYLFLERCVMNRISAS
jgi:hypothetical protein